MKLIIYLFCNRVLLAQSFQTTSRVPQLSVPQPEGEEKVVSPKLEKLVGDIAQLNLLEVFTNSLI